MVLGVVLTAGAGAALFAAGMETQKRIARGESFCDVASDMCGRVKEFSSWVFGSIFGAGGNEGGSDGGDRGSGAPRKPPSSRKKAG